MPEETIGVGPISGDERAAAIDAMKDNPEATGVGDSPETAAISPAEIMPPRPRSIDSKQFMEKFLPLMEKMMCRVGGAHWQLDADERGMWLDLMECAYPEFSPGWVAKPLFWMATVAIFGPRLIISVGIAVGKARGVDAGKTKDGDDNDSGEAGERKDVPE